MDTSPAFENLRPHNFVRLAAERVRELALPRYPNMRFNVRSRLFQCWSGPSPANHYELWLHERLNKIELGAHFEGSRASNLAHYQYLDAHLLEIHALLGSRLWLEDWDHGWVRLYETMPMLPLDPSKVEEAATRLCEIIAVMQPLLERVENVTTTKR